MRIAVIGAGNVGGAFTRAATQGGHTVVVTGTSVERAREVAQQTGATSVLGNISLNATNGWSWQSAWTLAGPSSLG